MGACRRVRERTRSLNLSRAVGRGPKEPPVEGETQELEPSCHGMNSELGLSHFQPDVGEHFSDEGIGGLGLQAGAGEDQKSSP